MRLFFLFLLSAAFFACADNPLAERVDELEQRLDEVEADQEEDRLGLLVRLDALALTADNAEEIGAVRAKLNQTSITRREFEDLQDRVDELEGQIGDWSGVVHSLQRSVYAVIVSIIPMDSLEDDALFIFVGTGFAVDSSTLVTNGHIIDALILINDVVKLINDSENMQLASVWFVVQNLTTSIDIGTNTFIIDTYLQHPEWDGDVSSPDIGTLHISEGYISRRVTLATSSAARRLRVGVPIATVGFPGELQGGDISNFFPIATFKNGAISALRPPFRDEPYTTLDTYIIQHNFDITGGTSGSPIFDASGQVVAINNASMEADFSGMGIDGDWPRIGQGSLGFGIRADKIHELLDQASVAAKPTTDVNFSELASRLDGRDISSLDIVTTQEDLAERLGGME
ncbi:MAG: trypsin-like peptidase domain-containing protein [Candidatus Latescibacteria bacterium]|nr:trypsin-like peptidase domain-containing protein [Candidatus Latescibacterota bacterium]